MKLKSQKPDENVYNETHTNIFYKPALSGVKRNIYAFFDFDGTVTNKDSFLAFIKFSVSKNKIIKGLIFEIPSFLKYLLGLFDTTRLKECFITRFFKGCEISKLEIIANNFALDILPKMVRNEAISRIKWHLQNFHKVAIVTGGLELYVKAWIKNLLQIDDLFQSIDVIGTRLEIKDGIVTGKIDGENCIGRQKVIRIIQKYKLKRNDLVFAYGDSKGDFDMFKIADYKCFRMFK